MLSVDLFKFFICISLNWSNAHTFNSTNYKPDSIIKTIEQNIVEHLLSNYIFFYLFYFLLLFSSLSLRSASLAKALEKVGTTEFKKKYSIQHEINSWLEIDLSNKKFSHLKFFSLSKSLFFHCNKTNNEQTKPTSSRTAII